MTLPSKGSSENQTNPRYKGVDEVNGVCLSPAFARCRLADSERKRSSELVPSEGCLHQPYLAHNTNFLSTVLD